MEEIKDIIEILELAKEEIENNDENVTAILDLQDLKSLKALWDSNKLKERQLKIKDEYLKLIGDIAYDYDGCNTVGGLKELIDELVELSNKAVKNDDTSVAYMGANGHDYNILHEVL